MHPRAGKFYRDKCVCHVRLDCSYDGDWEQNMSNLREFLDKRQREGDIEPGLNLVLSDIAAACHEIAVAIGRGNLEGTMGSLGSQNVQGEVQKQLDVIANDIFLRRAARSGYVAGMASEEMEAPCEMARDAAPVSADAPRYLLLFDPLDGSSNVNVNISVGTIFSVLRCPDGVVEPGLAHFLQPGSEQVCAGYALYGTSTMLVLTTGQGVDGFTLDTANGEFVLTHPALQIAADSAEFAVNMSNYRFWEAPVQRYIDECLQGAEGRRRKDFNMRWVASMVAEVHRILVRGGLFMYPMDSKIRKQGGKLRLLYEANPMSFIVEQAGGAASTGRGRILDIVPTALHQRVPVILGARNEVALLDSYH